MVAGIYVIATVTLFKSSCSTCLSRKPSNLLADVESDMFFDAGHLFDSRPI